VTGVAGELPGTYELVSVEQFVGDDVRLPFGPEPKGYMVFTAGGHMLTVLMASGRPDITTGDLLAGDVATAAPEELAAAFDSASAFAGRYELEGDTVLIHLEVATYPNWTGTTQVRPFELADGELSLYPPGWRVRLRRVPDT
jgi:hypothetical protein